MSLTTVRETDDYICDFRCTYQHLTDEEGDEADALYRIQFLQAFGSTSWDDRVIGRITKEVFDRFGHRPELDIAVTRNRKHCFMGDDDYDSFQLLFSYSTFHALHDCIGTMYRGEDGNEEWAALYRLL